MLRGMGFNNKTATFLASGKIYRSDKTMAPLLEMFPLLQTKETLASDEELAPFKVVLGQLYTNMMEFHMAIVLNDKLLPGLLLKDGCNRL
jgi:hypothetical protein